MRRMRRKSTTGRQHWRQSRHSAADVCSLYICIHLTVRKLNSDLGQTIRSVTSALVGVCV